MLLARRSIICYREFPLVIILSALALAKIQRWTIFRRFYRIHLLIAFAVQQHDFVCRVFEKSYMNKLRLSL